MTQTCRVAIIADDLTGALDAAAPFAVRGAKMRVILTLEHLERILSGWQGALPEVIAVNTESRHLDADAAASRVERAVRLLEPAAPAMWFKKVDSTLRGQVIAECLAMRRACGRRLLLAPAVPAQGRVVRGAEVFVEGVPLAQTAYGHDARSMPPTGALDDLFAEHGLPLARYVPGPNIDLPRHDCVADSATEDDLAFLYDAMARERSAWLPVGAAGLATVMAQRLFGRLQMQAVAPIWTRCLYALGSRSPRSDEQRDMLLAAADGLQVVEALAPSDETGGETGHLMIIPGGSPNVEHGPDEVAVAMAERVEAVVSTWPDNAGFLYLTGGDTAQAVLSRLGIAFIEVAAEWAPGVVLGYLDGNRARAVVTKAGGFGDPQLLVRLDAWLSCDQR